MGALWSENRAPKDRVYQAELIGNWGSTYSWYVETRSEPVTVGHRAVDLTTTLTASPSSIDPSQTSTLTAQVASALPAGYRLFIYDITASARAQVASCTTSTCTATVAMPWSENPSPKDRVYQAELIGNWGSTYSWYVETTSEPVTIYGEPRFFSVTLALTGPAWTAKATVTPSVSGTGYTIKIRAANGTQLAACASGPTCSASIVDGTYYGTVEDPSGAVFGRSRYWTLDAGAVQDQTVDGFNTYTLAAGFASANALCDALLTGPGTHNADATVTDQYLACSAVAGAGGSANAALRAAVALAGAAAVLLYIADYVDHYADPDTGTVSPPADPPPPNPPWRPVPAPVLSSQQDSEDIDTLIDRNPGTFADRDEAKVAMQSCKTVASRNDCLSIPIFVPGDLDLPKTAQHNREAIYGGGQPPLLNWTPPEQRVTPRDWYDRAPNQPNRCDTRNRSTHACDEYPFHTTRQGGPGASLKPVVLAESGIQGNRLSVFYTKCRMRSADAPPFIVAPAPAHSNLPTLKICKGR